MRELPLPTGRTSLNAPYGARCFLTRNVGIRVACYDGLNAPYGARCFLTSRPSRSGAIQSLGLNAPYGARCFLTRQRHHVVGWVQLVLMHLMALGAFWPKKHPSDQQARRQISRLFVATRRIATDNQNSAEHAGNSHQRRRFAPQPTHTRHNHQKRHTQTPGPTTPHSATNPGLVTENKPPRSTRSTWLPDHSHTRGQRPNPYDSDSLEYPSTQPQEPHPYART